MAITESLMTDNPCYKKGEKITVKGLMLHSVGCAQPNAASFISSWNKASYDRACVHAFIDGNDGTVYQTLPWDYRGWHCGKSINGTANDTHIGVEMCEPSSIKYVSGTKASCSDVEDAKTVIGRTYKSAVELFAALCKEYSLDPTADGVIISHKEGYSKGVASNHGDPEHLWTQLETGYTMDTFRRDVKAAMLETNVENGTVLTAGGLSTLSNEEVVSKMGAYFTADQEKNGILASVSMAQFLLESSYGKSELAVNANNCFGMKKSLSGNTWGGSAWDGVSVYEKQTQEQNEDGTYKTITAEFRKYPCIGDSIADHSAYLLGAMNGGNLRFDGLKGCTDYRTAFQIIKDGGYATSLDYLDKLCKVVEKWNLTKFDVAANTTTTQVTETTEYACPFTVRVDIDDLNIRKGAGTNNAKTGKCTGKGVFTITEVRAGRGATKGWGKLKSGAGWISLDYCTVT